MTVTSINSVPVNEILEQSAGVPAGLHGLSEKFSNLMSTSSQGNARDTVVGATTPMSHFIGAQEALMNRSFEMVRAFGIDAPTLDVHQLASRQIALSYELSAMQVQFNGGVYLAQSAKNGLQTLMKNQ